MQRAPLRAMSSPPGLAAFLRSSSALCAPCQPPSPDLTAFLLHHANLHPSTDFFLFPLILNPTALVPSQAGECGAEHSKATVDLLRTAADALRRSGALHSSSSSPM